ncbi:MAG TPA: hypothetical protein VJU61_19950 [Polyangiaceae bacterium]|nr:hypothetical protein [Polyangiaceae bacterium]
MKRFTIDARQVKSFADFVAAANAGFIESVGGEWNGNLDAFNDYLSWPEEQEYELELVDADRLAKCLGHVAQADWLRAHLQTCHPSNVVDTESRLALAQAGQGETLFDVVQEIITHNPHVHLVLR